jgi:hypothetical protein
MMQKIVLAGHPDNESTKLLVRLIENIFPECEVHVTPDETGIHQNKDEPGPCSAG